MDYSVLKESIIKKVLSIQNDQKEIERVILAIDLATKYHSGQKRLTGEDYIFHPLNVALSITEYTRCINTIIASVLHDILEDTDATFGMICDKFGKEVVQMLEGVTRKTNIQKEIFLKKIDEFFFQINNNTKYNSILLQSGIKEKDLHHFREGVNKIRKIDLDNCYSKILEHCGPIAKQVMELIEISVKFEMKISQSQDSENQEKVLETLIRCFKNYPDKIIKSVCLIKICDRLDNIKTIHVFNQVKQKRIIESTIQDILPLAFFLDNRELIDNISSLVSVNFDNSIQEEEDSLLNSPFNLSSML